MNGLIFAEVRFDNLAQLSDFLNDYEGDIRLDKVVSTNADGSILARLDAFVNPKAYFDIATDITVLNVRPYKFNKKTFTANKNGSSIAVKVVKNSNK